MTTERSGSNLPVLFESNGDAVELRYDSDHETFWATRRDIAGVFGCSEQNVDAHLKNIYAEREIEAEATTKKSLVVQSEGDRRVRREVTQYNLDAILSVGYRVNSAKAVKFRQWSTAKLTAFVREGAILDEQRLSENPELLQKVAARIRQIRHSEQSIYAKVRDIFKESSSDYASDSPTARGFFAMARDKFHYAVTQKTAAEIILERADPLKHNMGLVTVRGNSPIKAEATVGKNYLTPDELSTIGEH